MQGIRRASGKICKIEIYDQSVYAQTVSYTHLIAAIVYPMDNITDFLYLIGSVFAPMIAIQIADFFLLKLDKSNQAAVSYTHLTEKETKTKEKDPDKLVLNIEDKKEDNIQEEQTDMQEQASQPDGQSQAEEALSLIHI